MIEIGFHTDAFNSSYWNFEQCLEWAQQNGLRYIECGAIDGVSWIHGLGYQPHVALWEDPALLRKKMDRYGVQFSQIDAAFPLSLPEGATLGVEYVVHTIRWAKVIGCPKHHRRPVQARGHERARSARPPAPHLWDDPCHWPRLT